VVPICSSRRSSYLRNAAVRRCSKEESGTAESKAWELRDGASDSNDRIELSCLLLTTRRAEKKKRKAERKARREVRRGLLLSRAISGDPEAGVTGERKGSGDVAGKAPAQMLASASSKVRASAEVFLADVLGVNSTGKGGSSGPELGLPSGHSSVFPTSAPAPKLAPNKVALTNIVAGVIDHNERVQEEEDEEKRRRLSHLGIEHHIAPPSMAPHSHQPPSHYHHHHHHHHHHHLAPMYDGSSAGAQYAGYNTANSGAYAAYGYGLPMGSQPHLFVGRPPPPPPPPPSEGAQVPHIPPPTLPHALGRANGNGEGLSGQGGGSDCPPPSARQLQMQGLPTKFK
jgi:hypothetical protein